MGGNNLKGVVLQERDFAFGTLLADFGIMDREMVMELGGFGSVTRVNTRLLKLLSAEFIDRCFIGTPEGGRKAVYWLSTKGSSLLGVPYRAFQRNRSGLAVLDPSIIHQLQVNKIRIQVAHREFRIGGATFIKWIY
jgi:hypothetical protein